MHTYTCTSPSACSFIVFFMLINKMHLLPVDHSIAPGQCGRKVYIDT